MTSAAKDDSDLAQVLERYCIGWTTFGSKQSNRVQADPDPLKKKQRDDALIYHEDVAKRLKGTDAEYFNKGVPRRTNAAFPAGIGSQRLRLA